MSDLDGRLRSLVDKLTDGGELTPAWRASFLAVPRHQFMPNTIWLPQGRSLSPLRRSEDPQGWLDRAYDCDFVVIQVDDGNPEGDRGRAITSSASHPGVVAVMLAALDARPGMSVLEIGTGSGYNAALLAHRLGDDNVFSVDIDPEFVATARRRLASIGRHPHLAVGDGAQGWPAHAPYDRIIATCSVRRIPWSWHEQLTPGGQLLVDFKPHGGGNLVLLERKDDRLEGRFTARYAAFMAMRQPDNPDEKPTTPWQPEFALTRQRTTTTPAEPSGAMQFLRAVMSSTQLRQGHTFDEQNRQPTAVRLAAADGSCCEVDLTSGDDGTRTVREGGPTPLWQEIEHAYQQWCDWGQPGWDRIGITVTPETWAVWLDEPTNILTRPPSPCRAAPASSRSPHRSSRPSS